MVCIRSLEAWAIENGQVRCSPCDESDDFGDEQGVVAYDDRRREPRRRHERMLLIDLRISTTGRRLGQRGVCRAAVTVRG
jgi:hypothetical protein